MYAQINEMLKTIRCVQNRVKGLLMALPISKAIKTYVTYRTKNAFSALKGKTYLARNHVDSSLPESINDG